MSSPHRSAAAGLFALSAGVLCYELLLMRVFSVLMWYHFASLAIGLALLGLGAGGVAVGAFPRLRGRQAERTAAIGFAVGVLLVLAFLVAVRHFPDLARVTLAPFHQPFYKPFAQAQTARAGGGLTLRLVLLALLCGLPFFSAGVATAGALARCAPRYAGPYAATFLGSALGCALGLSALLVLSAPAALTFAATGGFVGAAYFRRPHFVPGTIGILAALLVGGTAIDRYGLAEIPFARGRYEPDLLAVLWNPMSRVAAFPLTAADTSRPPGLSRTYRGPVPKQIGLVVDDSGYTNLYRGDQVRENPGYFQSNLVSLAYELRPNGKALIFGPGGGKDLWIALSYPTERIDAVEINPQVVEMVQETFAAFTSRPYTDPRVRLTISDGRRFAATSTDRYDVIEASAVFGRLPPAAGAFTLAEDLLHTVEAFEDYWERLTPTGILSLTRFAYDQRALRLTALARALLDRQGIADPGRHVRVLSDGALANVLVSRAPFSAEDDRRLAARVQELDFGFLYPTRGEATALTRLVDEPELASALERLPFDVSPPSDDRPFFYYTVRPLDFLRGHLPNRPGFDNRGAELLRAAFGVLVALAAATILLPALWFRHGRLGGPRGAYPLLYALALGVGYMALEIGTMKRLILFLGHPIYAASATLIAFLLGSGCGSLLSRRIAGRRSTLALLLVAATGLGLVHAFLTPSWLSQGLTWSSAARWAVAGASILPLAFCLGAAFPAAMASLGQRGETLLPWAWAVNGTASVVGSVGSVLLAMNLGYSTTLAFGAVLYLLAAAALLGFPREEPA